MLYFLPGPVSSRPRQGKVGDTRDLVTDSYESACISMDFQAVIIRWYLPHAVEEIPRTVCTYSTW